MLADKADILEGIVLAAPAEINSSLIDHVKHSRVLLSPVVLLERQVGFICNSYFSLFLPVKLSSLLDLVSPIHATITLRLDYC